jgi:RNA polymerase sigma factor (TIGR02999 family)
VDDTSQTVVQLLHAWREGDAEAPDRLMPLVYDELRRLARAQMKREREGHTLQPTALAHEAYARLIGAELEWRDKVHFLSVAARVMRRVLIEHARARKSEKRGGDQLRVTLTEESAGSGGSDWDMLALDQALGQLERNDPRQGRAVELHYFAGLSYAEIAKELEVSEATVDRDLRHARAWLRSRFEKG